MLINTVVPSTQRTSLVPWHCSSVSSQTVSATMGDSLAVVGTHTQLMSCGFLGGDPSSTLNSNVATIYLEYATLNTDKCTFNERAVRSIDAYGSKINIADSRFYGKRSSCISWGDCQINIVRSKFAAHAGVVLSTINWSNLTVINTSFCEWRLCIQNWCGN